MQRLPPSKRFDGTSTPSSEKLSSSIEKSDRASDGHNISDKTAKKLAKGSIAIEDGKTYDMSLWKAIYMTIWKRWWLAVVLNGLGSGSRSVIVMLTFQALCGSHLRSSPGSSFNS